MDGLAGFLPLILIALVFWLLLIRPQQKRQRELRQTQSSLDVGTEVMLGSGIYATVVGLADDSLQVEIAPGTTVRVARQAVARVIEPVAPLADPDLPPTHESLDPERADEPERTDDPDDTPEERRSGQ